MTATASRVERWLLVEHRGAWGPESVPSGRMSVNLSRALAQQAAAARARLLLVRRPASRSTPTQTPGRWVFAVESRPGRERVLTRHVEDDVDLVALAPPYAMDPAGAAAAGGHAVDGPLYLDCTHGRHDRCCAILGRPVAQALAEVHPERVWESSHVGGDRFAANLVVLPDGLYLGRVDVDEVVDVVRALTAGQLPPALVRGRSSLPLPTQAAQQFARAATGRWGVFDLAPTAQEAAGPDAWLVRLTGPAGPDLEVVVRYDRHGDGTAHLLSCDVDQAKIPPMFRLVSLQSR